MAVFSFSGVIQKAESNDQYFSWLHGFLLKHVLSAWGESPFSSKLAGWHETRRPGLATRDRRNTTRQGPAVAPYFVGFRRNPTLEADPVQFYVPFSPGLF